MLRNQKQQLLLQQADTAGVAGLSKQQRQLAACSSSGLAGMPAATARSCTTRLWACRFVYTAMAVMAAAAAAVEQLPAEAAARV